MKTQHSSLLTLALTILLLEGSRHAAAETMAKRSNTHISQHRAVHHDISDAEVTFPLIYVTYLLLARSMPDAESAHRCQTVDEQGRCELGHPVERRVVRSPSYPQCLHSPTHLLPYEKIVKRVGSAATHANERARRNYSCKFQFRPVHICHVIEDAPTTDHTNGSRSSVYDGVVGAHSHRHCLHVAHCGYVSRVGSCYKHDLPPP